MATRQTPSQRDAHSAHIERITNLTAFQATVATATLGGMLIRRPMRLRSHSTGLGVCGTAGSTVVQVHVNGSAISAATLTTDNADADGTVRNVGLDQALVAGDRLEIVVSTAPTGGTDLAVTVELVEDTI